MMRGMPDLLIAPYLPLPFSASIGPWDLLPSRDIAESDVLPDELREQALGLIEAYRPTTGIGKALGAVLVPSGGYVGAPFDRAATGVLRHALLAGAVANNPTMALPEDEQVPNAGHAAMTSENALLYGHPLGTGSSYVIGSGVIVHTTNLHYAGDGEPLPKVAPPIELPPVLFASVDTEMAAAAYAVLNAGDASARRLFRALDWYRVALSNADAISGDVRVAAVRSALEALTGAGDKTKDVVRAVGRLLSEENTPTTSRSIPPWKGPVQLTADEWWLARLSLLRNAIVHDSPITPDMWQHEGYPQLDLAHDALIRCLKTTLATEADDPLLKLRLGERALPRASEELLARLKAEQSEQDYQGQ